MSGLPFGGGPVKNVWWSLTPGALMPLALHVSPPSSLKLRNEPAPSRSIENTRPVIWST
jgi:hypothetical protein